MLDTFFKRTLYVNKYVLTLISGRSVDTPPPKRVKGWMKFLVELTAI